MNKNIFSVDKVGHTPNTQVSHPMGVKTPQFENTGDRQIDRFEACSVQGVQECYLIACHRLNCGLVGKNDMSSGH